MPLVELLILLMLVLLGGTIWFALSRGRTESPATVLAQRFANGEIGEEEYQRRAASLTYGRPVLLPPEKDEPS